MQIADRRHQDAGGAGERADNDEQWNENNKEQRPDPAAHHLQHRIFVAAEQMGRAQQKVVKKIDHAAHASADDGVHERFSEAAFALHNRECFGRFSQNHD